MLLQFKKCMADMFMYYSVIFFKKFVDSLFLLNIYLKLNI
jgi:hypothetical protein